MLTSFVLVSGYVQLAVAEADIKKIAFRAGSLGIHKSLHAFWPLQIRFLWDNRLKSGSSAVCSLSVVAQ